MERLKKEDNLTIDQILNMSMLEYYDNLFKRAVIIHKEEKNAAEKNAAADG
jgi:hypothetical protein